MAMSNPESPPVVCAIDFGTTYSGYAFSFRDEPKEISMNCTWISGSSELMSFKTPTCVLLDPQKNFVAFGFEAENKYADLAHEDKHTDWFLFRKFRTTLYNTKQIDRATLIKDVTGKTMKALTIFSHAIRYMVHHFRISRPLDMDDADIQYVLTVPAIWSDKAKRFMRRAAMEAGIPRDQLKLALEPEAASICGQEMAEKANMKLFDTGVKYIIADLGGGSADIITHQKQEDGTLKELHRAFGGPCDGTLVDQQYLAFLEHVCGRQVMNQFIEQNSSDYLELLRVFEARKRAVNSQSEGRINFRLPISLLEICETITKTKLIELIKRSRYSNQVTIAKERMMRVDAALFKEFFTPAIDGLMEHLNKLLQYQELRDISLILLAGGFGQCSFVHDAIRKRFPTMQLIVPHDPFVTVLKGAVMFGHMTDIICSRTSKYAYGILVADEYDEKIHPLAKRRVWYGKVWCTEMFDKRVDVGEDLFPGKEAKLRRGPLHVDQTEARINVYCSESNDTRFVDDPGCYRLGHIDVLFPEGDTEKDKGLTVRLLFWGTEIKVIVVMDKTGEEYTTIVDCL